ncbi:WRC domain containing protein [Parasponia andersonii]|uniref:WRC domain containing protein n=1 Tax=Parasponia andersonii TaxID=3476 RepID=A0A2P5D494_PARAD|nr:WRC domain containing protein [Parasponia andersonii]
MRIRKNAKLSPLLFSSPHASAPEALQSHVCQLNQSPWDVIPFAQYSSLSNQMEGEVDSFTGNGSLADSNIGAVDESVASLMDVGEDPSAATMMINPDNNKISNNDDDNNIIVAENDNRIIGAKVSNDNEFGRRPYRAGSSRSSNSNSAGLISGLCQKNDGKGWQCKREAIEGYSFCEHHLSLLRSYNSTVSHYDNNTLTITTTLKSAAAAAVEATPARRTRGRAAAAASKKGSTTSNNNPYEFYYYSGFGPLWGRKRGERAEIRAAAVAEADVAAATRENSGGGSSSHSTPPSSSNTTMTTTASRLIDNQEFDYVDDEDEDADIGSGADSGKKRMRKPVKARSLKSLM